MRIEELEFDLPAEAIAQRPAEPRDTCRLMRLTAAGGVEHAMFFDIRRMLRPGDTLVLNDSKVLPARVEAQKRSGGAVEILFLRPTAGAGDVEGERWEALVRPSRRLRVGSELLVGEDRLVLGEPLGEGRWVVCGDGPGRSLLGVMEHHGRLPLPPYIHSYPEEPSQYQTVYAAEPGSAAAPTAGLHFTDELLRDLQHAGVHVAKLTLHVGLDTFLPIRESVVEDHRIHTESYAVSAPTIERLQTTRSRGGRIVAVGTTATRVLETLGQRGILAEGASANAVVGSTAIFITPGHEFAAVDCMLTNFHLPKSSVLALTMAFGGVERVKAAYAEALSEGYRFFSFGDAMLIERLGRPDPEKDTAIAVP